MNNLLKLTTVKLISQILKPWIDTGNILNCEMQIIRATLTAASKNKPAPAITPRLLKREAASELLSISVANWKRIESAGGFPFKKRIVGNGAVRYLNTEIYSYMLSEEIEEQCE